MMCCSSYSQPSTGSWKLWRDSWRRAEVSNPKRLPARTAFEAAPDACPVDSPYTTSKWAIRGFACATELLKSEAQAGIEACNKGNCFPRVYPVTLINRLVKYGRCSKNSPIPQVERASFGHNMLAFVGEKQENKFSGFPGTHGRFQQRHHIVPSDGYFWCPVGNRDAPKTFADSACATALLG